MPMMYSPVREKKSMTFPGRPVGKRKLSGLINTSVRCGTSPGPYAIVLSMMPPSLSEYAAQSFIFVLTSSTFGAAKTAGSK